MVIVTVTVTYLLGSDRSQTTGIPSMWTRIIIADSENDSQIGQIGCHYHHSINQNISTGKIQPDKTGYQIQTKKPCTSRQFPERPP